MSGFDQYEALASIAVTDVLADTVTITPRTGGDYSSPVSDPERPPFTLKGVFSRAPQTMKIGGQKIGGEMRGALRIDANKTELWISRAQMAAHDIRKNDLMRMGDRLQDGAENTGPGFCIVDIEPCDDDTGDYNLILTYEAE